MYLQLSTLRRRRISVGEWPQDMRLPALEELMQEFGVARVTVRQALALLEAEGLVTRKQGRGTRSEEHTSELQSLMRISYAVFCLKKKTKTLNNIMTHDAYES